MALKSTVFKCELQVNDLDRHYYATHGLTLARHPSETDERMMMRLLAFAMNANDRLAFAAGLSDPDEPDLWERDDTGAIDLWIQVGLPEVRALRKAAGRSGRVIVLSYGRSTPIWWKEARTELLKIDRLEAYRVDTETSLALAAMAQRNMQLQFLVQDGASSLIDDSHNIEIAFERLNPR
ncbi:YaeQ family protein [soil metagenome]